MKISEMLADTSRGVYSKIDRAARGDGSVKVSELRELASDIREASIAVALLEGIVERSARAVADAQDAPDRLPMRGLFEVGAPNVAPIRGDSFADAEQPDAPFLRADRHRR